MTHQGNHSPASPQRRRLAATLCAQGALATLATLPLLAARAQGKVLRIVVPFGAGGARDVLLRVFHTELGAALGQSVIVENRPGAGGATGTAAVARAEPDGNTLIFAASSHHVTALLNPNAQYDPLRDFAAVANIGMQSYVLLASAQNEAQSRYQSHSPGSSLAVFLRDARAQPGKLNYTSAGIGSSTHLAMAYFNALAGLDLLHIPHKSTQDAILDVLAGRAHAVMVPNVGALPYLKDKRLHILGVTSPQPSRFLPGVPSIAQAAAQTAGHAAAPSAPSALSAYVFDSWFGLLAPAKTPRAVIERINTEVAKLLAQPVIAERLAAQGVERAPLAVADFDKLVRADHEAMVKVVKSAGTQTQ